MAKKEINKQIFSNPWFYISVFLAVLLVVAIAGTGKGSYAPVADGSEVALPSGGDIGKDVDLSAVTVDMESDAVLGDADAPITIYEYSDYECPFCARFYTNTLPALEKEYIETGKVKIVFKDFPLSFHAKAQKAHEAAEVARALGGDEAYWMMHDKIFENQNAISVSDLKRYARDLGLDGDKFDSLLDSGKFYEEVQADFREGQAAGVTGTPSFVIDGELLVGAQPIEAFREVIDSKL